MFSDLLPHRIDNDYLGHKLALWLFGLLVFIKMAMGVNSIFLGHKVATSADGIPLDKEQRRRLAEVATPSGRLS